MKFLHQQSVRTPLFSPNVRCSVKRAGVLWLCVAVLTEQPPAAAADALNVALARARARLQP